MSRAVVAVAVSGGRDSLALLHVTARLGPSLGLRVVALHVHHGLMPQAEEWLTALRRRCARWRRTGLPVELRHRRLAGRPPAGESIEAWARRERYAALADMAREAGAALVLLAHHRQDQAETVLLQALRGAGPRGLAGMPALVQRDGLHWARPWLGQDRLAIEAYVRRHRLRPVDDASNRDPRFARSRLRESVWPVLVDAFPDAAVALAAAAQRAQEAARCLDELAGVDAAACVDSAGRLRLQPWLDLSPARRQNLVRHWLGARLGRGAPQTLVQRVVREAAAGAGAARWPGPGGEVVLHRGRLCWRTRHAVRTPGDAVVLEAQDLSRPGRHAIDGWPGRFEVRTVAAEGVPAELLADCDVRVRRGGERFQFSPRSVPRSLKKQFQAAGVPAHERDGPLVYAGDRLVYVPGLGIDARVRRASGEALRSLCWLPDSP